MHIDRWRWQTEGKWDVKGREERKKSEGEQGWETEEWKYRGDGGSGLKKKDMGVGVETDYTFTLKL